MPRIRQYEEKKTAPGESGAVDGRERLKQLINAPVDIELLGLNENARQEMHLRLVQSYSERSNEVPAYPSIRRLILRALCSR